MKNRNNGRVLLEISVLGVSTLRRTCLYDAGNFCAVCGDFMFSKCQLKKIL